MSEKTNITHLLWVDLEMSGLDVEKEVIIEVAALVTDIQLKVVSPEYHAVVKQPQQFIDNMDEWNKTHHGQSGLIDKIPSGKAPQLVETELVEFIKEYIPHGPVILSGNSIGQDRLFINHHWPLLANTLHYRMLDVTAWKILFENLYNIKHEKKDTHRASDDIHESIEELKTYMKFIKI